MRQYTLVSIQTKITELAGRYPIEPPSFASLKLVADNTYKSIHPTHREQQLTNHEIGIAIIRGLCDYLKTKYLGQYEFPAEGGLENIQNTYIPALNQRIEEIGMMLSPRHPSPPRKSEPE